jgi:hypothetical protein
MSRDRKGLLSRAPSTPLTDDDTAVPDDASNGVTDQTARLTMTVTSRLATPTRKRRRKKNDHDAPGEIETSSGTIRMISQPKK